MKRKVCAGAVIAILCAAAPAWANFSTGLISVCLGGGRAAKFEGKGVLGEDKNKWNMLAGGQGVKVGVVDVNEDLTDVSLTFTSDGAFSAADGGFSDTKFDPLFRSYLHARNNGRVTILGLTPNAEYDLVVYSGSNTNGRRTTFTVGKESKTTTYKAEVRDLTEGVNYARFVITADAQGTATVYYGSAGRGDEGNINGLQISPKPKK